MILNFVKRFMLLIVWGRSFQVLTPKNEIVCEKKRFFVWGQIQVVGLSSLTRSNFASFKKNISKQGGIRLLTCLYTKHATGNLNKLLNWSMPSINMIYFRKFVAIKNTPNDCIALFLDLIQQCSISNVPISSNTMIHISCCKCMV